MALSDAFNKLKPGDLIQAADDKGGGKVVVIRTAALGRLVLGRLCGCNTHVDHVYFETFIWDAKNECLVDTQGGAPSWWSADATKEAGEGAQFLTEEVLSIPVASDFPWFDQEKTLALLDGQDDLLERAFLVRTIGGLDDKSFILHLLKAAGVNISDEQANLVFGAATAVSNMQKLEAMETFAEMLGAVAGALRSGRPRH